MKYWSIGMTITAIAIICCCTGDNGEIDENTLLPVEILSVELPGFAVEPGGDTVTVPAGTRVLLYYWLPLNKHPAMEEDLLYLSSIDSTVLVLPIQFDENSRNHAQRIVNSLEVSMAVYLADSSIGSALRLDVLPVTALFIPDGSVEIEEGFGSPRRLLGDSVLRVVPSEIPPDSQAMDSTETEISSDSMETDSVSLDIQDENQTGE